MIVKSEEYVIHTFVVFERRVRPVVVLLDAQHVDALAVAEHQHRHLAAAAAPVHIISGHYTNIHVNTASNRNPLLATFIVRICEITGKTFNFCYYFIQSIVTYFSYWDRYPKVLL